VALVQAGTFWSDAGALFGPVPRVLWDRLVADEITADHRLGQALNCLLIETPAGRVLVETGIGERMNDKAREMRSYSGDPILVALRKAGLLDAAGARAFPRAVIVAQRAEWEIALGTNSRLVASYDQPELRLVRDWGAAGWAEGEREILPGVTVVPTGGHSAGHQAVIVRGPGPSRPVAFFGDLAMRPWSANPRWITAFDDFPLDSVQVKGELFQQAVAEDWTIVLSHEPRTPVGRMVPDRDRFVFEPVRVPRG
jgi:glyoxylase-like metal-dependent hydrolase (beta-lactamase superfamily II)